MKSNFKPLLAAGFLLMALATAAAVSAVQPPGATPVTVGSPSPSAAGMQPPIEAPLRPPPTASASAVTADAAPESAPPGVAAVPVPVPAPATETPALVPEPTPAGVPEPLARDVSDTSRYEVAPGDTVSAIASRFGVDANVMLAANGLGVYTPIFPGQQLKLSGPPVAGPPPAPAATAPSEATPAAAAPAAAAPPAVPAAGRTIYVAGAGGQAMVDRCIGPIHFTPTDAYSLFITEHDSCGGWARFSGIGIGETVSIPGFGTFTATGRGIVPQGSTTDAVAAVFGGFPRAILQTCIPGTTRMLLIGLN